MYTEKELSTIKSAFKNSGLVYCTGAYQGPAHLNNELNVVIGFHYTMSVHTFLELIETRALRVRLERFKYDDILTGEAHIHVSKDHKCTIAFKEML